MEAGGTLRNPDSPEPGVRLNTPILENLERLAKDGTFAVVTGQRVGLFVGRRLRSRSLHYHACGELPLEQGIPVVPVFRLAFQDHDLAEVAQVGILDDEYNLISLADHGDLASPRSPVGNVRLTGESGQAPVASRGLPSCRTAEPSLATGPARNLRAGGNVG